MLIVGIVYMFYHDIPLMVAAQYMTEGAMLSVLIAIPLYLLADRGAVDERRSA